MQTKAVIDRYASDDNIIYKIIFYIIFRASKRQTKN